MKWADGTTWDCGNLFRAARRAGTGLPVASTLRSLGITKINIDTEIRDAFRRGVEGFMKENPDVIDPRKFLKPAIDEMYKIVSGKIKLFGSSNAATDFIAAVTGRAG